MSPGGVKKKLSQSKQSPEGDPNEFDLQLSCCRNSNAMLVVSGYVNTRTSNFLIDSGASSSFINEDFVRQCRFKTQRVDTKRVRLANGQLLTTNQVVKDAAVNIHGRTVKLDLIMLELSHDVILGYNWLSIANPTINFNTRTVQFCSKKHSDDVMQLSSTSLQPELTQPAVSSQSTP